MIFSKKAISKIVEVVAYCLFVVASLVLSDVADKIMKKKKEKP